MKKTDNVPSNSWGQRSHESNAKVCFNVFGFFDSERSSDTGRRAVGSSSVIGANAVVVKTMPARIIREGVDVRWIVGKL